MPLWDPTLQQISTLTALAAVDGAADYFPGLDASSGLPVKVLSRDVRSLDYYDVVVTPQTNGVTATQNVAWHMPYAFFVTDVRVGMRFNTGVFTTTAAIFRDATEPSSVTNPATVGNALCTTNPILGAGNIINITGSGNTAAVIDAAQASLTDGCYMRAAVSFSATPTTTNNSGIWVKLIGYRA